MNEDGKKMEVLVEDRKYTDPRTGVELPATSLTVWADKNMKEVIKGVAGVTNVYNTTSSVEFSVYLDPRYDVEHIKREIVKRITEAGKL